jgi:hypothetical protein
MPRPNRYTHMRPVPDMMPDDMLDDRTMPAPFLPPPTPPPTLTASQKKHFDEIVRGNPHLNMLDASLLASYVRVCEQEAQLSMHVAENGPLHNGRHSASYRAWTMMIRTMLRYMHALKLGPMHRDA